jgi:hypothetical protein
MDILIVNTDTRKINTYRDINGYIVIMEGLPEPDVDDESAWYTSEAISLSREELVAVCKAHGLVVSEA